MRSRYSFERSISTWIAETSEAGTKPRELMRSMDGGFVAPLCVRQPGMNTGIEHKAQTMTIGMANLVKCFRSIDPHHRVPRA